VYGSKSLLEGRLKREEIGRVEPPQARHGAALTIRAIAA
jgi:hypothetical protein